MRRIMIDLETLGGPPDGVIFEIAAVEMDEETGFCGTWFRELVDPVSCERVGMRCDSGTAIWWTRQGEEARKNLEMSAKVGRRIEAVLEDFVAWVGSNPDEVWCFGASFDFPILDTAFKACGMMKAPWGFRDQRCLRTLAASRPEIKRPDWVSPHGARHTALVDAMQQAVWWKLLRE
jgi:hypothetical protein